jgi:tetratricopeptide (TPR) repeat protein
MNRIRTSLLLAALAVCASAQDVPALAAKAVQMQTSGDYAGATEAYRELLKIDPNDVATHVNLGVVLVKTGHYDEAISEYEAAEKLLPGDPRIALNIALAYEKSGRIQKAAERFEALHASTPDSAQVTMLLADCNLQLGNDKRVIALLDPLHAQTPDDPGIAYMLGMALLRDHQTEAGGKMLDLILRNGDTAESRFLLGVRMFESQDYPAAVKQFGQAIALNPNLPGLQAYYGSALLNTGDPDAATAAFEKELQTDPNSYTAHVGLAQIFEARRQFAEAAPHFQKAQLLRPQAAISHLATAHAPEEPPKLNSAAPDFELPEAGSGRKVHLAALAASKPTVLVFGSYSCPNFRSSADALTAMRQRYGSSINFLLVYIREAHSTDEWQSTRNTRDAVTVAPAANMAEKEDHAAMCSRKLHLTFPAVVDTMDGAAENAYHAWPSRAFVIGSDRRILYSTRLTELDFHPDEMDSLLRQLSK